MELVSGFGAKVNIYSEINTVNKYSLVSACIEVKIILSPLSNVSHVLTVSNY